MNSYYSNIFWHFTGSPKGLDWTRIFSPNDILKYGKPKSDKESIEILGKILTSNCLKAFAKERIDDHLISNAFCCVTDIPIQNLNEHRQYYGNVAIGFKHEVI